MKKILSFAFVGAIALAGAFLVSCSSDDSVADNPTYNGETVKTQFTIALPGSINTRMTSANVQDAGYADFLGIRNIKLLPFAATPTATSTTNGSVVSLTDITALEANNNSKVYSDVAINVGTTNFLFYGQANKDDGFDNGKLVKTEYSSAVSDITFTPAQIISSTAACGGSTKGQAVIALLNTVAQTEGWSTATNVKLKNFYDKFITLKAGSSQAAKETLEDLYQGLEDFATGTEGTVQADLDLATAIKTAIENAGCDVDDDGILTLPSAAQGYPEDLNLPRGAARILWDADEEAFADNTTAENAALFNVARLTSYVYPASLQYFVSSTLKAADQTMTTGGKFPSDTYSTWEEVIAAYTGVSAASVVSATTRSIAIVDEIQYGVGRLDASVAKLPATMYDYNGDEVDASNGYTLTAVIIGGQKAVDWKFNQTTVADAPSYTIYDKSTVQSTITASAASQTNYTLALESKAEEAVYVALEFTNNGDDFVGKDGEIIPAGATFYLIGQLNPKSTKEGEVTQPSGKTITNVFLQDYKTIATFTIAAGNEGETNITGLGSATNTIPDLRTPKMELGLSVNLTWEQGITFNVEL